MSVSHAFPALNVLHLLSVVKLVFSFYLSYPLAGLLKRIPDKKPWQKNAFNIA